MTINLLSNSKVIEARIEMSPNHAFNPGMGIPDAVNENGSNPVPATSIDAPSRRSHQLQEMDVRLLANVNPQSGIKSIRRVLVKVKAPMLPWILKD